MHKVSVVIPCYNQAQFLLDALNSVFSQSYDNWECIIVNDGSTDNTEELALEWKKKDCRFKYIFKENGGLASARNAGLNVATGQYLQFLDADDIIAKNKFQLQIFELSKTKNYALCYCDYFASSESNLTVPIPSRYLTPKFKSSNYLGELITNWEGNLSIPCHCFLFKSEMFTENSICFDESLPNHEDWECWMNIFTLNPEVYFLDQTLVTYRIQPKSLCHDSELMQKGFLLAISKQKSKFRYNGAFLKLLSIKKNSIKYGVNTSNTFYAFLLYFIRKIINKIKLTISIF